MMKKFFKYFSIIITPIFILAFMFYNSISQMPDVIYVNDYVEVSDLSLPKTNFINKIKVSNDKINLDLLGLIPVKTVSVQKVDDLKLYIGGNSVGVRLNTQGVLVIGFSDVVCNDGSKSCPAKDAGIQLGDTILKVDGEEINSSKDLGRKIRTSQDSTVKVVIMRENQEISKEIKLIKEENDYKIGLWVRDSTAGIGTLTFYDDESKSFGALGHPITDGDTNKIFSIKEGDLLESTILSVKKGMRGTPGELRGLFVNEKSQIGSINQNTSSGIYGKANVPLVNSVYSKPLPVAFRNEVKEGKATIVTTVDDKGPKEYDIEIIKLLSQDKPGPKSMVIKITDEELLSKTGGIVQGMSGSPIIQDGKIIGAVTHVLINKPELGYGIYIEWMLQDCGILK